MSETRDMPTIDSSFAAKTALEETEWPDRTVDTSLTTQDVRDWLSIHGFPNGRGVNEVDICGGTTKLGCPELYLVLKVWYSAPGAGKFFLRPFQGEDDEPAYERRVVPMRALPGGGVKPGWTTMADFFGWLASYGVGDRVAKPVRLRNYPGVFSAAEWHKEDGKIGLRTTRIRTHFTPEEKGEAATAEADLKEFERVIEGQAHS